MILETIDALGDEAIKKLRKLPQTSTTLSAEVKNEEWFQSGRRKIYCEDSRLSLRAPGIKYDVLHLPVEEVDTASAEDIDTIFVNLVCLHECRGASAG